MSYITDIVLRLSAASIGYLTMVACVAAGDLLSNYIVLLPMVAFGSLVIDFGRVEKASAVGLLADDFKKLKREGRMYQIVLLPALFLISEELSRQGNQQINLYIIGCLVTLGLTQVPLDAILRGSLLASKTTLELYRYQIAMSALNLAVAAAALLGCISQSLSLLILTALPWATLELFLAFRKLAVVGSHPNGGQTLSTRNSVVALVYKAVPSVIYVLAVAATQYVDDRYAIVCRSIFFMFGFIQVRLIARQTRLPGTMSLLALLFAGGFAFAVPLIGFKFSSLNEVVPLSAVIVIVNSLALAAAYSVFLKLYERFLKNYELPA